MTNRLSWDDLRCLEALARLDNVGAATRELGLSTSTLYRRLASLEEATGVRCLVRGSGPTELTKEGKALAATAHRTHAAITRAVTEVRAQGSAVAGDVSLTTVEGLLPFLAAPLEELAARYPQIRVRLHLGDSGPSVRGREVDVAIGVMARPPPGCWGRRLFRIHYGVFGTEAAWRRDPVRWVALDATPVHRPEAEWEAEHAGHVAVSSSSRGAIMALVRASVGVGLLPKLLARLHPELVERPFERTGLGALARTAWVLTHESARQTPRVLALTSVLARHLGRL